MLNYGRTLVPSFLSQETNWEKEKKEGKLYDGRKIGKGKGEEKKKGRPEWKNKTHRANGGGWRVHRSNEEWEKEKKGGEKGRREGRRLEIS